MVRIMQILALNIAGQPFRWLSAEDAMHYQALGKVAWSVGDSVLRFRGGWRRDGRRSHLETAPIIAIAGSDVMSRTLREHIPLGDRNDLLFRRDRGVCAYCGATPGPGRLTRDHVIARSRGGRDLWTNVVTACRGCNMAKGSRTPEEFGRKLLYVPYAPCRHEHFILSGRNILADQMEYLKAQLPAHSRWSD